MDGCGCEVKRDADCEDCADCTDCAGCTERMLSSGYWRAAAESELIGLIGLAALGPWLK
jgi:hypothetical protein